MTRLYVESYTPPSGGDARDHYPFLQLLDPVALADSISTSGGYEWLVAERDGEVVGTLGVKPNVGGDAARIAEFVGLVVGHSSRNGGIATRLVTALCDRLRQSSVLMIAETRTADSGGWRALRRCGFHPFGFEPFAHATPAGLEPMLLLGRFTVDLGGDGSRDLPKHPRVRALANAVLSPLGLPPALGDGSRELEHVRDRAAVEVERSSGVPAAGPAEQMGWSGDPHDAGVVGLDRIEGIDPSADRYEEQWFVASRSRSRVARARVIKDRRDGRARIAMLRAKDAGARDALLGEIVASLVREAASSPLTIVVDVRADSPRLHEVLDALGFFPTVYYPRLIAESQGRVDAVQFTHLSTLRLSEALDQGHAIEWPAVTAILEAIS